MNRDSLRQAVNVIATLAMIAVNTLAETFVLNGKTSGEISDRFASAFVPAGYTFAVWSVIYLGLLGFAVYQALPAQRESSLLRRIGYAYALTCVANCAWILLWHYEQFVLTEIVMLALLGLLLLIYVRLDPERSQASSAQKWLVLIPFSLYLGWITVATIANTTVVLLDRQWSGWGLTAPVWSAIMIIVATAIVGLISLLRVDSAYALVVVWALGGIIVGQAALPIVVGTAVIAIVLVLLALLAGFLRQNGSGRRRMPAM